MDLERKVEGVEIGKQLPDFVLLQPGHYPARSGKFFNRILSWREIEYFLTYISKSEIVAVDLETRGNDYSDSSLEIVGVGLAWDTGSCYISYTDIPSPEKEMVKQFLLSHPGLIAHNVYFDGGVLYSKYHEHPKWYVDTLSLYMQTANEGYAGQTHGLKDAQVRLLGWESSNETELDEWLVVNGYYRGNRYKDESREHLLHMYRTGATSPDKGEMWRAPIDILGKYCILDAESTYLLYTKILRPVLNKFPALASYHIERFVPLIKLHIEQKIWGILMDREGLLARQQYLTKMIDEYSTKFITHSTVLPGINQIEKEMCQELVEREPEKYKKLREMPQEPAKYTKSGQLSKNWDKWFKNRDKYLVPEISKNWLNWKEKLDIALRGENPDYRFNLNSGPQLRKLIYEILKYPVEITTESGDAAIGIKALKKLDAPFDLLIERNYLVKELTYISDYLERIQHRDTMHPSFRLPGTSTGRLSSKGPNLQQVPKSKAVMSLFQARPGNVWVDLDFCLHPDTEYLTKRGWKVIGDLQETDEVWQVDPKSLQGSWVVPSRIIYRHYSGKMYSIGNVRGKLDVTEHHRMLWTNQKRKDRPYTYQITESQEGIPSTYYSTMQTSSSSDIRGYCPTYHELNLACLLQADSYWDGSKYHVQLSKLNKREEATHLLGKEHAVYPPRGKQTLEVAHWWNISFKSPLLRGKSLWLEDLDTANADALVSCLTNWDGHVGKSGETCYYSTDLVSIDQVQRYLVRCGYECRLTGYQPKYVGSKYLHKLTIRKSKGLRLRKGIDDITTYDYEGNVGCITVPTGCILVRSGGQTFVTGNCALEPTVTAEFSGDPNMQFIYGNNAPPNDIYLFVGAQIPGRIGDAIRATGFDPYNPNKETLARAKKECKSERSVCKTVVLACAYGAGVNKVNATLEADNIYLPEHEVRQVWETYWNTFADVKKFGYTLESEWRKNGGYILNGLGRPMCVTEDYKKDLLNRFIQSTGHDILIEYILIICEELDRSGIPWQPSILDWHDAAAVEVPKQYGEQVAKLFLDCVEILNDRLQGTIKLRGTPMIGVNLAETKEPEE